MMKGVGIRSSDDGYRGYDTDVPERKKQVDYYDNGNVRFQGSEVDGKPDGRWEFFRRDGSIMRSGNFKAGEQVGEWVTYDRQGNVKKVTQLNKPSSHSESTQKI